MSRRVEFAFDLRIGIVLSCPASNGKGVRPMVDLAKHLQVGQNVRLETVGNGYQITPLNGSEVGLAVVAVEADYIILDDADSGVKTRIPSHFLQFAAPQPEIMPHAA
jgi:hypothetical protein